MIEKGITLLLVCQGRHGLGELGPGAEGWLLNESLADTVILNLNLLVISARIEGPLSFCWICIYKSLRPDVCNDFVSKTFF